MTAGQAQALDAIAFRLLGALERYELAVDDMLASWPDMEAYGMDSVNLDEVRLYSASLPRTSVAFLALLIARAELFQCLFMPGRPDPASVADCTREHAVAVAGLRRKCVHLLGA